MGGLITRAAGALSNGAAANDSELRAGPDARVGRAGVFSMAEWQISQAEQVAEWEPCDAQSMSVPAQARGGASIEW